MSAHLDPGVRHDAVYLFDVLDGNPNGDPDAEGAPRTDDETGHGLVTDVAIKRKIRDVVPLLVEEEPDRDRYGIFVEAGHALQPRTLQADQQAPDDPAGWLRRHYFDVRMFGGVFTRGRGAGGHGIRGPVQITFARTLDPVLPSPHAITRITQTRQEDLDIGERTELGTKWVVPYGLYRAHVHYSGSLGIRAGVTSDDLGLFWNALICGWDHARSAVRNVSPVGLWIFSHRNAVGVAPARTLLDRIVIEGPTDAPPRHHSHYRRALPERVPDGVTLTTVFDCWS